MNHIIAYNKVTGERFVLASFWNWDDAMSKLDLLNASFTGDFEYSIGTFDII